MKTYITWEEIKKQSNYEETINAIRNHWYGYAEGFYSFSDSYLLNQNFKKNLPIGWQCHFDIEGNAMAFFLIETTQTLIIFKKNKSGKEMVSFA